MDRLFFLAPPFPRELETGTSGGAKERETKEVRKRAYVHMGKATECISQILHGWILLGGPCVEEELHDGGVTCMTSNHQSCVAIVGSLVDISTCLEEDLHDSIMTFLASPSELWLHCCSLVDISFCLDEGLHDSSMTLKLAPSELLHHQQPCRHQPLPGGGPPR